jgi:hypothetical protein
VKRKRSVMERKKSGQGGGRKKEKVKKRGKVIKEHTGC